MKPGEERDPRLYDPQHIEEVLDEIRARFGEYFAAFASRGLKHILATAIEAHEKEREAYEAYLDLKTLEEYEYDPNAFKSDTRRKCPIIRRCLMSQAEFMRAYKRDFNLASGRQILDTVKQIASFAQEHLLGFDDELHEAASHPSDLGLEPLETDELYLRGVIGYGIQGTLLHGAHPRQFAHRSQNSVWALYFLTGRKDFGFANGSEFMMILEKEGTCEQNYFYPADLFGYYSLQLCLMLRETCAESGVDLDEANRYIYLSAFCDHVADRHRHDIDTFKWSSADVESRGWF